MSNTYTQEQIDGISRFEINKAVGIKRGVYDEYDDIANDYVGKPERYMAIAIEHGIDINFNYHNSEAWCYRSDFECYVETKRYDNTDTGLAVCAAFLMMEKSQ